MRDRFLDALPLGDDVLECDISMPLGDDVRERDVSMSLGDTGRGGDIVSSVVLHGPLINRHGEIWGARRKGRDIVLSVLLHSSGQDWRGGDIVSSVVLHGPLRNRHGEIWRASRKGGDVVLSVLLDSSEQDRRGGIRRRAGVVYPMTLSGKNWVKGIRSCSSGRVPAVRLNPIHLCDARCGYREKREREDSGAEEGDDGNGEELHVGGS